jgi:hypothetical protein
MIQPPLWWTWLAVVVRKWIVKDLVYIKGFIPPAQFYAPGIRLAYAIVFPGKGSSHQPL